MKNKRLKRFSIFTAALLAINLMVQGFASLFTDIANRVVYAIEGNYVYLAQKTVEATNTNLVYVDLVVKGEQSVYFDVRYQTFSGTAIEDIDYNGVDNSVTLKIGSNKTEATYKIAIKCLNDINNREKLRLYSGDTTYGRYFNLKITDVKAYTINSAKERIPKTVTIDPENNNCKCYLTYNNKVEATIDATNDQTFGSKVSYINDYKTMLMQYDGGTYELDGGETRKSWKKGISFNNETTQRWLNTYINEGLADAYGSMVVEDIDDSGTSAFTPGQGKVSVLMGNKQFIDNYKRDKECPGLLMYGKINPPGVRLNGKAMHYISQWVNPYKKDKKLVDISIYKVAEPHDQIYWILDRDTWFASKNSIYDSEFYRVDPYNGVLDLGAAGYNHNDECDMYYKNIWLMMTLYDNTAPTITAQYSEYNTENGALRIYVRFNEPVYTTKKGRLKVKINNYNTDYNAKYIEGNFSDTLVYEVGQNDLPKVNITSVKYVFPSDDIADMSYKLDCYKIVRNNYLQNATQQRESNIIGNIIDLNRPLLNVDLLSSGGQPRNIYNIVLSANDNGEREFNSGTIYYSWTHEDTIDNPSSPLSYKYSHILTSEERGSFTVSLAKNESEGIESGNYYLHALAVSKYGFMNYKTFGPYILDGDAPDVRGITFPVNNLQTKTIDLQITKKSIKRIILNAKYKDSQGNEQTAAQTFMENGVIVQSLANIFKVIDDGTILTYRYTSNIDSADTSIPIDTFIKDLMGANDRFDLDFYYYVEDVAGNRANTDTHHLTYDIRELFTPKVTVPASYTPISDISLGTNVYNIANISEEDGIKLSIDLEDATMKGYIDEGATFSVVINDKEVRVADVGDKYFVTLTGLTPGYYDVIARVSGNTSGGEVDLVSKSTTFYLTNNKEDNTANKDKINGNLVLSNKVFQLEDARFYYYDTASNSMKSHLYGAIYSGYGDKYEGGSSTPTFSSSIEAKKYVKYMEYQDLYLISITDTIASLLNSGTGSTVYVKAANETRNAQAGQLWVRYKKNSWTTNTGASGWAFYYYGEGSAEDGININTLSANLAGSIETVTNRIVSEGKDKYLVNEDDIKSTTGEPYLTSGQMHVNTETVNASKCGTPFISGPTYNGDANLYQNEVTVNDVSYPLATNLALNIDNSTSLYFKELEAGEWQSLYAKNGQLLKNVLSTQATGVYTIREYANGGVSEFSFYLDKSVPQLNLTKDEGLESKETITIGQNGIIDITELTCTSVTLNGLTDADPQAYVAVYSYPNKSLQTVLYANEIENYALANGNYYLQVGDRSGNTYTIRVLTSDSDIELDVSENESNTGIIVKVNNRTESEIYSYEVYLNETLIDSEFATRKIYRDSGIYRIEIVDIYGNRETRVITHESPSPDITWYYLNENDSYSVYDPSRPTRMILEDDLTSPRTTNVYSSTLIRLRFNNAYENGNVKFELQDIDTKDYSYNESTGVLSINSLSSWRLRVWYEEQPNNDHIYVFHLDNDSPEVTATFIGTSFSQYIEYDDEGNQISTSSFDFIDYSKYDVGDTVTLDNLLYEMNGTATLSFENNAVIAGSHIVIQVNDPSGIRSFTITRNGQPLEMELNVDNKLLLNSYGHYVLTFTDNLGNVSVFSFTNVEGLTAAGFVDTNIIEQDIMSFGHDELIVKTLYNGNNTIIVNHDNKSETYVFTSDGKTVIFGQYIVKEGGLDEEGETITGKHAEFVASEFILYIDDNLTKVNNWYVAIDNEDYLVYVMIDDNHNVHYKVACIEKTITVESSFTVGNVHLPSHYIATLSKEIPTVTLLTGGEEVEQKEELEYIYIADDLTIKTDNISPNIKTIEYSYNINPEFENFITIYENGAFTTEFVGHEDGFYQIVVTNIFNNKTTYLISKIDSFASVVKVHTVDGSEIVYFNNEGTIYSNSSIELIIYSDSVYFVVNNQSTTGYYEKGTITLELTREGTYDVRVVGENGIYEDFKFEISSNENFVYHEEWITGYNEDALLRDQGYTNTNCTVHLGEDVVYIEMIVNDDDAMHYVLYDNITPNKRTDPSELIDAIGRYGVGKYTIQFRNKYGDLASHTVHYNNVPSLLLDRITTTNPSVYEVYDLDFAIEHDFYSNYVLRFSTSSTNYIFTINGEQYRLDEPKTIEFSNSSGNGSFSYEVTYLDEYGNYITFNAILLRQDLTIDVSNMNTISLGSNLYTRDDICVVFGEGLKATVSIDGDTAIDYESGYIYYGDGEYAFVVRDIAGNRVFYTVNHKSMNHYSLVTSSNGEPIIFGGVVNNSNVTFRPSDGSKLQYVFRNGELLENYSSYNFTQTGFWQILIVDEIGNQSYEEFYVLNNSLCEFIYNAPFDYEVTEVWRVNPDGGREILNYRGPSITLDQNGDYVVVVTSTKTITSFNFSVTINDTPPSATLNGVEDNGVTARNVTLSGLKVGDIVKIYKDGELINTIVVTLSSDAPTISLGGRYRITVTNVQGVTVEYNFVRKSITNVAGSIFVIVTASLLIAGIAIGLVYHTKLKTDD